MPPECALEDLVSVLGGGTPPKENAAFYGGDIPWVTPKDMKSWEISNSQIKITQAAVDNSAARVVPAECVLIVVRSGVLKHTLPIGVNRVPVAINQDLKALKCGERLDPEFLARFIQFRSSTILSWVRRTTADNFPVDSLKNLQVPVPPISEQRSVARLLRQAEGICATRRQALRKIDVLLEALFIDHFGDPGANGHDWERLPLGELCTEAGEYGSGVASMPWTKDRPRYVRITDVTEIGDLTSKAVSPSGPASEWERYALQPGDMLFARSGATVGKTYLHREHAEPCVFAGYLIRFRPDEARVHPEYLFRYTKTRWYRHWVAARKRVVAQPNINAKQYGNELLVPLPPRALQEHFARKVGGIEQLRVAYLRSLDEMNQLLSALASEAFRRAA